MRLLIQKASLYSVRQWALADLSLNLLKLKGKRMAQKHSFKELVDGDQENFGYFELLIFYAEV